MKVKTGLVSTHRADFEKLLLDEHEKAAKKFVKTINNEINQELRKTLAYDNESGTGAFVNATPKNNYTITRYPTKGVEVKYHVVMLDTSTRQPHFIWHLLNKGRKTGNAKSDVTFRVSNSNRTTPHSLEVKSFSGYSGWRTVKAGKQIKGIRAREWYRQLTSRVRYYLRRKRYAGWETTHIEYKNE